MRIAEEKYKARIEELLTEGERVRNSFRADKDFGHGSVDHQLFAQWISGSKSLIASLLPGNSHYIEDFKAVSSPYDLRDIEIGIGIIKALQKDVEMGLLREVRELITAEVFSDFLDIASHLLENGYKDPAASLIGAVLEDGLRKIAIKHDIKVVLNDDISSLNTKIFDKKVYSSLNRSQIQTWKKIRDFADHGKFNEYESKEVENFLEWTKSFLSQKLA